MPPPYPPPAGHVQLAWPKSLEPVNYSQNQRSTLAGGGTARLSWAAQEDEGGWGRTRESPSSGRGDG